MRWETVEPKNGNERTVQMFLWFPVTINNETRWLEQATIRQRYQKLPGSSSSMLLNSLNEWTNIEFLNK